LTRRAVVLCTTLIVASALPFATSSATPPVAPSCVEDVRTAYAAQPTTTTAIGSSWSPNGRYVAFTATTITGGSGDTNGAVTDAVVRDRQTGALEIASRETGLAGAQLGVNATALQVSDNGNLVLFASAGEFVTGETNGDPDIYLRDRLAGTTVRVDLGPGGTELAAGATTAMMSADGAYVVFTTNESLDAADLDVVADVYRYNVVGQTVDLVSVNDNESEMTDAAALLGVDATGTHIYFSVAAGPTTYHVRDVTGLTTASMPTETGFITRPGTSLVINTATSHSGADADALVDAYLYDIAGDAWTLISDAAFGLPAGIAISANSVSTDLNFVNLTFDDGHPASVVVNRGGGTFRYAGPSAAIVSALGDEVLADALVYRVGLPEVYSVAPTSIVQGTSTTLTVTGRELTGGASFFSFGGAGLTYSNLVLSGNSATLTLSASSIATLSTRAATFTQGGSAPCVATLVNAITVTAAPPVYPAPIVDWVDPALIRPNTNTAIEISGSNFQAGAAASSPLTVQSTTFDSATQLSAVVNSTGATEGIEPITVTNPDTKSDTLTQAMLVRSSRGEFHSLGPVRVLDTRSSTPIGPNSTRNVQVAGAGGVPSTGVRAVLMNVTVAGPTAPSYLTIFPTGTPQPNSSSLNFVAGQAVPNLVTATVGANGMVTIYNFAGSTHVLFDVVGWYSDVGTTYGGTFVGLSPIRALDTRFDFDQPLGAQEYITLPIVDPGAPISAVMMNVTVTGPTAPSYLTIWPNGFALPNASSLNFVPGQTVPNLVVAPVGADGSVNIFNFAGTTEVIVDIVGLFENGTVAIVDGQYEAVQPFRALDTRITSAPVGPGQTVSLDVRTIGVPDDASVLMMNVTAVTPTAAGYVTVYPGGEAVPETSNLNFSAGQTVPNAVAMRIGTDHRVRFRNALGSTHLIVDVTGWYRPGYAVGSQFSLSSTPSLDSAAVQTNAVPLPQPSVADWLSTDRPRHSAGDHHAA
jgi:serine protease